MTIEDIKVLTEGWDQVKTSGHKKRQGQSMKGENDPQEEKKDVYCKTAKIGDKDSDDKCGKLARQSRRKDQRDRNQTPLVCHKLNRKY